MTEPQGGKPSPREIAQQATRERATRIFREAIDVSVPSAIETYKGLLQESSAEYERGELGEAAVSDLERHRRELDVLGGILEEFRTNRAAFVTSIQQIRPENGTITVRMQRVADGELKVGQGNEQTQLSLHVQLPREESVESAIQALSLRGLAPQDVLEGTQTQQVGFAGNTRITVNTVRVYRSPYDTDAIRIVPQAGIRISSSGGRVETYGVKFVGTRAHMDELHPEKPMDIPQHAMMVRYAFDLARQPQQRPPLPPRQQR